MRIFLSVLLFVLMSAGSFPAGAVPYPPTETVLHAAGTLQPELKENARKKRNKRYKKPKKKKFLGIFKRKSSCDCPKH